MPFVSKAEFQRLLDIIDIDEYESEIKERCDAIIEATEEKSKNILDVANLEASQLIKINESACAKYRNKVKENCVNENRLIHDHSMRILKEAYEKKTTEEKELLSIKEEKNKLQIEINALKKELTEFQQAIEYNRKQIESYVEEQIAFVDHMYDGLEFEEYFADLLERCGFTKVSVTRGTGDSGVDVLGHFLGIPFAFQCKRYHQLVGNKAVQEVFSGMSVYGCCVGVVVTNSTFSSGAIAQADANHVLLWGREELKELIRKSYKSKKDKKSDDIRVHINGVEVS